VYSIITFATLRPYEFIRNGPILHRLPVRIVGIGGGFEYGHAGTTHYGLEDLAVMRIHPALAVVAPADHRQACSALAATWNLPGPVYYRVGKDDSITVPGLEGRFAMGRLEMVREGSDLLIVALGSIAFEAVAAAQLLESHAITCAVAVVSSFNPSPIEELAALLGRFARVMTVEAHYINGGLGSLVAEVIAERGLACRLVRCGIREMPAGVSDTQISMERACGLSRNALVDAALAQTGMMAHE
jgi:transketolase